MEHPVMDPVCGKKLNPNSGLREYRYLGQTYYFCSIDCMILFDKDREKYTGDISVDFQPKDKERDGHS